MEERFRLKARSRQAVTFPFFEPVMAPPQKAFAAMKPRVDVVAAHMLKQMKEHEAALANTNVLFNQLLDDLNPLCEAFSSAFSERERPGTHVSAEMDADRSVGILHVLWHTVSFTARGNTRPLALHRPGRDPMFTGRIVALLGDFQDLASELQDQTYPDILQFELASLFVPADPNAPAVMRVRHLGDDELHYHQADAPRLFLMKTIEMVCGGGFFHEKEY